MSRSVAQFAREIGVDEVTVRVMLARGYSREDVRLLHGDASLPENVAGEAVEASIRRYYKQHGKLPCGEGLRVVDGKSKQAVAKYEHDCWLDFQFNTGTDGDSLLSGGF